MQVSFIYTSKFLYASRSRKSRHCRCWALLLCNPSALARHLCRVQLRRASTARQGASAVLYPQSRRICP